MKKNFLDEKIKSVKEHNGLFRRSHFISLMYQSKKQHELEMNKQKLATLEDELRFLKSLETRWIPDKQKVKIRINDLRKVISSSGDAR